MSYKRGHENLGDRKALVIARYRVKFSTENRQNSIRVLWLHFDVVKTPIGWLLIHFSKTTSKKRQNPSLTFTLQQGLAEKTLPGRLALEFPVLTYTFTSLCFNGTRAVT